MKWAHNEIGITFGVDKPLLILKEKDIEVDGLPSFLSQYGGALFLEYDPYNLTDLKYSLALLMPAFRGWIEGQNSQSLLEILGNIAICGLAIFGGIEALRRIFGWIEESS
ncbi:MAG: hypothetical protein WAM14_14550 [Candidatus Nitrosopolaris sp.]